ncbi:hypothetical protein AB0I81_63265 [Nonomuraea sp. NPDC050404]|uniref:hypothetical protein n=1 Tax=Nonomuraea sp. NPDC050404 TaxID=3155783 RepID=UPI0033F4A01A
MSTESTGPRPARALLIFVLVIFAIAGCASTQPAGRDLTDQQMVRLLQSALPQGEISDRRGRGLGDQPPSAQLLFESGGHAATVTVKLNRQPLPVPAQYAQCPDTAYHPYSTCTQSTLPGGATLMLDRSPRDEEHPSGPELLSALLTHRDGKQVLVSETGDAALPLTLGHLAGVATATVWNPVLAAMPAPPARPQTGSAPRLTGHEISRIIERLLPRGLRAGQPGGSDGFGHVTADDGHGESLVAANVQQWKPGDPAMAELFKRSPWAPTASPSVPGTSCWRPARRPANAPPAP